MIKVIKNNVAYYFENEKHKILAEESNLSYCYLALSQIAIDLPSNNMLKCRYSLEDTFDKFLGV